jgi:gamma-glutamyltranspeptidase
MSAIEGSRACGRALRSKPRAVERARLIDPAKAACAVEPSVFDGLTNSPGGDTIYLSVIDKDGNIVSLIQSLYGNFGSGLVAPGTGIMLHNRGGLFTLDEKHPNVLAPRKRPLHTIIPAFMQKGDVRSASASWAASTRPRRTRSLSPTSPITGWTFSRRSRRAASRRRPSPAAT